jgi:hypothetical protein
MLATDHYWTFYPLLTDNICGISYELRPLDLTVEGSVSWAGRDAVRLVGVPGAEWDWGWDPDPLSWGADEYEVVDAERGILLRCASRLRGKDFDALEVEEIHFDERFAEEVFSSRQPPVFQQAGPFGRRHRFRSNLPVDSPRRCPTPIFRDFP